MTFDVITPYLKGFYLTLNSWRSHRDEGDWRVADKRWQQILMEKFETGEISEVELNSYREGGMEDPEAPSTVKASISLVDDVRALLGILFSPINVPEVNVRCRNVLTVIFGFGGDHASGIGLGATFTCGSGFNFRIGVWGSDEKFVESLEEEGSKGNLSNAEVYMFMDDSTVESRVARGSS